MTQHTNFTPSERVREQEERRQKEVAEQRRALEAAFEERFQRSLTYKQIMKLVSTKDVGEWYQSYRQALVLEHEVPENLKADGVTNDQWRLLIAENKKRRRAQEHLNAATAAARAAFNEAIRVAQSRYDEDFTPSPLYRAVNVSYADLNLDQQIGLEQLTGLARKEVMDKLLSDVRKQRLSGLPRGVNPN